MMNSAIFLCVFIFKPHYTFGCKKIFLCYLQLSFVSSLKILDDLSTRLKEIEITNVYQGKVRDRRQILLLILTNLSKIIIFCSP